MALAASPNDGLDLLANRLHRFPAGPPLEVGASLPAPRFFLAMVKPQEVKPFMSLPQTANPGFLWVELQSQFGKDSRQMFQGLLCRWKRATQNDKVIRRTGNDR
jgi:hypothetical protein